MIKREGIKKGVYILPNLLTLGSLFCGFFAIVRALTGDFESAAWAIMAAGIFDGLDGRVARLTRTQSDFGIELDSLVDLVSFGLAPALTAYMWNLSLFHKTGWGVCFVYVACGALRLARYNVQFSDEERKHFQGIPIPTAAYAIASYILFAEITPPASESWVFLALVFAVSILMVSTVPYHSFKNIGLRHRYSFFYLVVVIGLLFLIMVAPHTMIFLLSMTYISSGVVEKLVLSQQRIRSTLMPFLRRLETERQAKPRRRQFGEVFKNPMRARRPAPDDGSAHFSDIEEKPLGHDEGSYSNSKEEALH